MKHMKKMLNDRNRAINEFGYGKNE